MYYISYNEFYKEDVIASVDWYFSISKTQSIRFIKKLKEAEEIILSNPKANAVVLGKNYRRCIMNTYPYKIFYSINDYEIKIIALVHSARSNKFIKRRLNK